MEGKLKVLLIVGKNQSFRMLDLFESMGNRWDLSVASFLSDLSKSCFFSHLPLKTFIEDPHLPGFMRGIEDEVAKSDLVVVAGIADPASIQVLRACCAQRKALVVFIADAMSIRSAYDSDSVTATDFFTHARGFLTYDEEAAEFLEFVGIAAHIIITVAPRIAHGRIGYQPQLRKKFRDYIGLKDEDNLILSCDALENYSRSTCLLMALTYLKQIKNPLADSIKILFAGSGPAKEQLKYLAVDAGIAKQVLFLSQDTGPFLRDLYSAADLAVSFSNRLSSTESEASSLWILDGMACGLRPLVDQRHPLARSLSTGFLVPVDDFEALGLGLQQALLERSEPAHSRRGIVDLCRYKFDASDCGNVLADFAELILNTPSQPQALIRDFTEILEGVRKSWGHVPLEELLQTIACALEFWDSHPEQKGQLLLIKGQILLKENNLEGAMNCFELCTADESVQREAYIGLARIAYLTYSYDEALSFYRKALAIKPNDPEAMAGIGYVYRRSGMADDAVYWLGKSLSVDAYNLPLLMALTQASLEAEDRTAVIGILEQMKSIVGDKAPLIMALGQLYYLEGDFQKGRMLVDQALEMANTPSLSWRGSASNM